MTDAQLLAEAIQKGEIAVPTILASLPSSRLEATLANILKYYHTLSHYQKRAPRAVVLAFIEAHFQGNQINTFLVNLSITGALIMVDNHKVKLKAEDPLQLVLDLSTTLGKPGFDKRIIKGKVIRRSEFEDSQAFYGIRFGSLDQHDIQFLEDTILKLNSLQVNPKDKDS